MAMPEVDAGRVGAMGGSQGGGLTLACAALTPTLNRIAPTFPFLCDYKRVWEMDLDVDAYAELRSYSRSFDPGMSGRTKSSPCWATSTTSIWPTASAPR